jgi:hypothetical protein
MGSIAMNLAHAENTEGVVKESGSTLEYKTQSCCWGWPAFGALVGLLGGIVAALVGSMFTAISWITGVEGNGAYMQTLGTVFLFLTIPLLVLGAHCLDVVEKGKK